ncbi:MAG: glycosyltransferase [Thermoplasmata archaeon]
MQEMRAVIVPSDYIKKMAEERFPYIQFKRIHHFVSDDFRERDRIEARRMLGLDENKIILLSVSTKEIRKNNALLARVMNRLDGDYILLKIGSAEGIVQNLKDKRKLIEVKNVPYDIYPLYFNASDLLIFPSPDEGFGLPVIEAIKSRIPVIASDIPVMRKITWNRVPLVDPMDDEKWVEFILKYSNLKNKISVNLESLIKYYSIERGKSEYELFLREILNYGDQ